MADRPSSVRSRPRAPDKRLARAYALIERDFLRGPSLRELGKAAGLSPFHFQRRFKRTYGVTPKQLLDQVRVRHVKKLLQSAMSCAEASKAAGYVYPSHMTTHFKRVVGMTPTKWLRVQCDE